jgi:hypothetical protein
MSNLIRLQISKVKSPSVLLEGYKIVLINELVLPYSFFSAVFVNGHEFKKGQIPGELFSHEFAHIVQRHTLDIIFVELLKVFFWFNPIFIYYKKAIMLNHEYLADEVVTKSLSNLSSYKDILLNIVFRNHNTYLASSFNYSFTKKRLLMMTKKNYSKKAILKKIAVIPLFLVMGFLAINAQDTTRRVVVHMPPPPPPPPPQQFGQNMWWAPILKEHNITPDPSKSWYSENLYETGDEYAAENGIVTLKGNVSISIKSTDKIYRIIKSRSAIFDTKNKTIKAEDGKIETFKQDDTGSKLIHSQAFKKSTFHLVDDYLIAPPPPPPPAKN